MPSQVPKMRMDFNRQEKEYTERIATPKEHSAPCQQIGGTVQGHLLLGNLALPISSESLPFASLPSYVWTYFIFLFHFLFSANKIEARAEKKKGKYNINQNEREFGQFVKTRVVIFCQKLISVMAVNQSLKINRSTKWNAILREREREREFI